MVGDAELDEGNIWEARRGGDLVGLGNVLWIVDLNRQSLDRVIPGIRVRAARGALRGGRLAGAGGKYGRRLQGSLRAAGRRGAPPAHRRDEQRGVPGADPPARARRREAADRRRGRGDRDGVAARSPRTPDDGACPALLADLGGHDIVGAGAAFAEADADKDAPTVVFAYTIKGWGLPFAGDPMNHSALLTDGADRRAARPRWACEADDRGRPSPTDSPEGRCAGRRRAHCERHARAAPPVLGCAIEIPAEVRLGPGPPRISTQKAFGDCYGGLARTRRSASGS